MFVTVVSQIAFSFVSLSLFSSASFISTVYVGHCNFSSIPPSSLRVTRAFSRKLSALTKRQRDKWEHNRHAEAAGVIEQHPRGEGNAQLRYMAA